jgi:hypothetical protein
MHSGSFDIKDDVPLNDWPDALYAAARNYNVILPSFPIKHFRLLLSSKLNEINKLLDEKGVLFLWVQDNITMYDYVDVDIDEPYERLSWLIYEFADGRSILELKSEIAKLKRKITELE